MPDKRIALVTGANRGIGLEVARQLCARDFRVWLGVRDPDGSTAAVAGLIAEGHDVKVVALDVTSDESVSSAAAAVAHAEQSVDVLVNNAGVAQDAGTPPSEVGLQTARTTFGVNVFGCIRVTQAFLPLLRRSAAGRVVMVSSDIGSLAHQTDPSFAYYALNPMIYSASKAALNAVTIAFAKELRQTAIKVNAANPGFTATDLNGHRGLNTVAQGAAPIVELATLGDDGPTGCFLGPDGPEPW
jgi:NAD(P)-dependent dehydrogenase (short-subunit alcohol dehydrogenase family)